MESSGTFSSLNSGIWESLLLAVEVILSSDSEMLFIYLKVMKYYDK